MKIRNRLGPKLHSGTEGGQDGKLPNQKVRYHARLIRTVSSAVNKLLKKGKRRKNEKKSKDANSTLNSHNTCIEHDGDTGKNVAIALDEGNRGDNEAGHEESYEYNQPQKESHHTIADLVARNQFLSNPGKPADDLSRLGKQITDIDSLIEGSYGIAKAASASGSETQVAGQQTDNSHKLLAGKAMSMVGAGIGTSVGIASTIHQAYKIENSLKKTGDEAINLIGRLSVKDILKERKGIDLDKKVTLKEVETVIRKKMGDNIAKKTTYAGLTGAFTVGGGLSVLSLFFPPLAIAALVGLTAGVGMTLLFRSINKRRMASNLNELFRKLDENSKINTDKGKITGFGKVVLHKINNLNGAIQQRVSSIDSEKKKGVADWTLIDNSISAIGYSSGVFGLVGRLISVLGFVAIGLGALASFVSAIFTGFTNYRDRQKRLKTINESMRATLIPNVMGRSFPYFREPLFKSYIKSHKSELIRFLNLPSSSSVGFIIRTLNKEENREIKHRLKNQCVKYCVKKEFCSYAGIQVGELNSVSPADFDQKYGDVFKRFLIEKFSGEAFKDTVKAGASGCLGISGGFLTLSFFPGISIFTLPMAGLTAVLGGLTVFLAAKYEQNKFKHAARLAVSDKHLNMTEYNKMKHLVCSVT